MGWTNSREKQERVKGRNERPGMEERALEGLDFRRCTKKHQFKKEKNKRISGLKLSISRWMKK